ncbi:Alpha/Beta hydrolase protein [Trichoderma austrokoningii]
MGSRALVRAIRRGLGCAASSSSQSREDEDRANLGIREFPPRPDLPLPEISGANVQHVDIIAVHGLSGNWLKTWVASDGAIWLRDRLPQLLAERNIQARVLSYGYDTSFILAKSINNIEIVAGDLISQIDSIRTTDEQKKAPIIFVAHSLGGLVVKAAFNKACTEKIDYQNVADETAGYVFLGVPHRGADLAGWASKATTIVKIFTSRNNNGLVGAISRKSHEWKKIGSDFTFRATNLFITSFFETEMMGNRVIVDQDSARLGIPGERVRGLPGSNHLNICKFGDGRDESDRFLVLGNSVVWTVESALRRGQ